jgi:hypothetical protein
MIQELILTLTQPEKDSLRQKVTSSDSSLFKLIEAVLDDPEITKEQIQKRFKINENTYFKNLSLAKDEIYEVIKHHMRNSYDDLLLSNLLYRRGLDVHASKLRLKLEAEYDSKGWWSVLHELYSFDMMVAYAKCDIARMKQLKGKIFDNADRLHQFIKVDREVIIQMAIIEKGDLNEKDFDAYAANMNTLLKQAKKTGHHIPVFNALHSLFVLYTKYKVDLKKANAIISEMVGLVEHNVDRMIPYTTNVAWLNTMGFHIQFATEQTAASYFKRIGDALSLHGLLYDSQALINFCSYYFLIRDKASFNKRFEQFRRMPTDKSFHYNLAYLSCLHAYLRNDAKAFNQSMNDFYSDDSSREYNDQDLTLRYLELVILVREENYSLASGKLEATIKFIRRNFTSHRVEIEKKNWDMLRSAIQGKTVKAPTAVVYRLTEFLYDELKK